MQLTRLFQQLLLTNVVGMYASKSNKLGISKMRLC